jgi:signal transduction histidine kinase/ABC-type nitrate/sulfonate/bicarbonate transport system substrate-binding protein/DNA-binding NarL/FixJ family response regulator
MKSFFLILFFLFSTILYAKDSENVTIQLKWKHSFQFAGYYAAIEKGFYKEEDLNVTLKEIDFNRNFIKDVTSGYYQYGVSDSSLVVYHLQKIPVVLVAQIFQHSPLVLLSHRDSNITTPYEMIGKKVMYSFKSTGGTPFQALILKTIGNFDEVNITDFTSYQNFIDKKIDVTSAYSTFQPYWLKKKGIEVNIIDPKSYGIDFYGDNFFTSKKELKEHPERVKKMKRATLKGWQYALSHQDEMINLILKKYAPSKTKDLLEFEARGIYQMIMPDLTKLGNINRDKYEQVVKTYYQLGIVKRQTISDDFFYDGNSNKIVLTKEEREWIKKHPKVIVGGGPDWAPFDFVDSKGKYIGIANDYLNLISEKTGLKFDVQVDKWSNNLQKMKESKIDLLDAVYYTDQRATYMNYTKPYFEMLDYFFIRDDLNISTIKDLNGKRVAMPKGYAHGDILKKEFPKIKIVAVDTFLEAIYAVLENRADALFDTYVSLSYVLKKNSISTIIPFKSYRSKGNKKLHMSTSKNRPLLTRIIDKGLLAITDDEKEKIYNRWVGKAKSKKTVLTKDETQYLIKNPTVTFTGNPDWLPFEAFDKSDHHIGIVADYLKELEKELGVSFKPTVVKKWEDTLNLSSNKNIDLISGDINDLVLSKNYDPIKPYFTTPIVIITNNRDNFINDLEDIKDQKIAIVKGYGYANKIYKKYPLNKFVEVKEIEEAFDRLLNNNIQAILLSLPVASYMIKTKGLDNLKITGKTTIQMQPTLFIDKDKPLLKSAIEKAMKNIHFNKHAQILGKWQEVKFAEKTDYTLLFQIAGLLGFFLLGTIYWNRKLSYEIKERKKIEKELAEAKKQAEDANMAKSEFLANMSHEIRTPMNSVLGFSELLEKQIKDPVQKDYLDSIIRGGNTLLDIINDILDLSKIEAGKIEMTFESVNIKQLALEMESIFSVKLIQKNLHFELDIDPNIPKYLLLDNTRIRQILFNLIGNAIKFTDYGSIKLSIKKIYEDEQHSKVDLQIVVEDTGIGIDNKNLKHIFDAFEQQLGQDNQKYGGTGLGLAICKKLTHMMGGEISVKSELNKGTKFTINLPNISVSTIQAESINRKKSYENIQFEKATILIVDDIKDNRKLVSSTLDRYNLDIIEAKNGQDAIESLKNIKVDLIFLDIKMPVMDGYEAAKIIKNDQKLKNIPLIALTASAMGEDLQKINEYKFDGYLRKPVSSDDILEQLSRFLKYESFDTQIVTQNDIEIDKLQNLPNVIKELRTSYKDIWHEIKDMGDFKLIYNFADSLEMLGKENGISLLVNYAKELKTNCDSFDIDRIDFIMNSFEPLIEKLDGLADE